MISTTHQLTHCPQFNRHRLGFRWEGTLIPVIPSHFYERFHFYLWEMKDEFQKEKESNQAISILTQSVFQPNSYYIVFYFFNPYDDSVITSDSEKEIIESLKIPKSYYFHIPIESKKKLWYNKYHITKIKLDQRLERLTIENGYPEFEAFLKNLKVTQQFGIYLIELQHPPKNSTSTTTTTIATSKPITVDPTFEIAEHVDLGRHFEWIPFSFEEFPFTPLNALDDFFSMCTH
jgi:hypothetical protein